MTTERKIFIILGYLLFVAGFSAIIRGAFMVDTTLGWFVTGVCLLYVGHCVGETIQDLKEEAERNDKNNNLTP